MLEWKMVIKDKDDKQIAEFGSRYKYRDLALGFDIIRDTDRLPNSGMFSVYNLSESDRNLLHKSAPVKAYDYGKETDYSLKDYRSIVLSVNKDKKESIIFKGTITECHSLKQDADWITKIKCGDGSFANKFSKMDVTIDPKNNNIKSEIDKEAKKWKMSAVFKGEPNIHYKLTNFRSLVEILDFAYPNNWFIDCEKINCFGKDNLGKDSKLSSAAYIISDRQITESPKSIKKYLRMEIVFMPELKLGQIINLDNNADKSYNGEWELAGIEHRGELGNGTSGIAITDIICVLPGRRFKSK